MTLTHKRLLEITLAYMHSRISLEGYRDHLMFFAGNASSVEICKFTRQLLDMEVTSD